MKSILEIAKIAGCISSINEYNKQVRNMNAKLGIWDSGMIKMRKEWHESINRLNAIIEGKQLFACGMVFSDFNVVFGNHNVCLSAGNEYLFSLDEVYVFSKMPITFFDVFNTRELRDKLANLPPHDTYQITDNKELQFTLMKARTLFDMDFNYLVKAILKEHGFHYDTISRKVRNELKQCILFVEGGQALDTFKLDLPCMFLASFSGCLEDAIRVFGGGAKDAYKLNEILIVKNNRDAKK